MQSESTSSDTIEEPVGASESSLGWNAYVELVNGRVAMLAVPELLILELLTGQDMFTWLGLR